MWISEFADKKSTNNIGRRNLILKLKKNKVEEIAEKLIWEEELEK